MSSRLLAVRPPARVLAILIATLVFERGASPQDRRQPPIFRTDATYVRVDVYPTANGAPVNDLRQDEFEVLEDGAPQRILAFEQVTIRANVPQEQRREPNTVAESRALLENPRARVFVIFLDTYHVDVAGSHNIRAPLIRALDQLIGPEDLVAVMTPLMAASDLSFARRTTTIEGMLTRHWNWGERGGLIITDPTEVEYQRCYPGFPTPCRNGTTADDRGIADTMIARRREKVTLDALRELVEDLEFARDERKALLVISDGWLLYGPDASLGRQVTCEPPSGSIVVEPRTGGLGNRGAQNTNASPSRCEADRQALAALHDDVDFERLLDLANRANVTFYPIDPRGLPVFDTSIDSTVPRTGLPDPRQPSVVPGSADSVLLRSRQGHLRDLASATDGIAVMNSNDLDAGLRRVTADLSSYYLFGYYSTGKPDGKFHNIRVRVKRPGIQVRARRGYLAPTAAELAQLATRNAASAPAAAATLATAAAMTTALDGLGRAGRDVPLRLSIASGWKAEAHAAFWVVGEFRPGDDWNSGGSVDVTVLSNDGRPVGQGRQQLAAGARSFRVAIDLGQAPSGDYTVRVRAQPLGGSASPTSEIASVRLADTASGAVMMRRGQMTGNRDVATSDPRFRRNEQIRIELPDPNATAPTARLLDRTGNPLPIPLTAAVRTDPDGTNWISLPVTLASLAPADYIVEVTSGDARTLVAFRVIP